MCLAIPMKLERVEGTAGEAEVGGARRTVQLHFLPEAKAGDYVIVHAGFAIERLDEKEAAKTLDLIRRMAEGP